MKTKCFSYIRYSSRKQSTGTSEDRQLEIAPRVAHEMGWELDPDLNAEDLGFSGWSGSNLKTIESIIQAAKDGSIPQGTVMILEALDRLTRLNLDDAYQLFRRLLKAGIEIYTDSSRRHLKLADLNNPMSVMMTVVELDAAFQYSDKLSDRVGKAWKKKRDALAANGKRLTKKVVGWVDFKTWTLIPERTTIVKRIYDMYLKGHGISTIVKTLNTEKVPTWGRGKWNSSYVSELLHSKAVIGQFQGFKCVKATTGNYYNRVPVGVVIENYYPPIFPNKDIFHAVQAKLGNSKKVRKNDTYRNLLSGRAYCTCDSRMFLANGYYMCWGKIKGTVDCKQPSLKYQPIEDAFSEIFHFSPEYLCQKQTDEHDMAEVHRGQLSELHKQIANITNAVKNGRSTKALVEAQAELEKEVEQVEHELMLTNSKKVNGKHDAAQVEYILNRLGELPTNKELRRRVKDWCLANVDRITFNNKKLAFTVKWRNGNTLPFLFSRGQVTVAIGDEILKLKLT